MELGAVLPMTAEVRDDHLFVGGVDMVELAHKEGTALYVMDEADMRNRMETYLKATWDVELYDSHSKKGLITLVQEAIGEIRADIEAGKNKN